MKVYEIVPKGTTFLYTAVKQGKYFRHWDKRDNKVSLSNAIWLQSECEILPAITDTEEFLPVGTEVVTSHFKYGLIIESQYRDEKGNLHPAKVGIATDDFIGIKGIYPIWENQLIKAIKQKHYGSRKK